MFLRRTDEISDWQCLPSSVVPALYLPEPSDRMDDDGQIKTLLQEAGNAKAWFAKIAKDLREDPTNEELLRLQELCRHEFDKRWDKLADLGVPWSVLAAGATARPRIAD